VILSLAQVVMTFAPVRWTTTNRRRSAIQVVDIALAENVGQIASLPILFVGSGSYFLSQKQSENTFELSGQIVADDDEIDLYRDTLLRYAGYANEVGEAFRPIVPAWIVPGSYGVAITYVFADTVDKTIKAFGSSKYISSALTVCAILEGLDAFLWQITASVALPGYTIHQVVEIVVAVLTAAGFDLDHGGVVATVPTAFGLLTIPFIVKPLDELAEQIMDFTLRKLWAPYLESCTLE